MHNLTVRYGVWPPWAMKVPFGNGTAPDGVLKDVFEALSSSLKYEFKLQEQEDHLFGARQPDGTYNGILGALARKDVDIGGPFVASEERAFVVDFTNCLEYSKRGIITGIQSADRNMFLYFKVFSWEVWLLLFLTLVFCALISILIDSVSLNRWKANQRLLLSRYCWIFGSYLIGHDAGTTNHGALRNIWYRYSFRILVAAWLLGPVLVSLYTFQGKIISTLAITKLRPIISGLEELKSKKRIIPVTTKGSATEICFKTSKDHGEIWDRMQNNTIKYSTENIEEALVKVEKGTHVLIVDYIYALSIASNWVKRRGRCSVQVQELLLCQSFIALAFRKGFDQDEKKKINSQLTYIIQAKLTERWLNRVLNNYTHCTRQTVEESKPIDITDILGGFVLWATGITIAALLLIAEIMTFKNRSEKWNRTTKELHLSRIVINSVVGIILYLKTEGIGKSTNEHVHLHVYYVKIVPLPSLLWQEYMETLKVRYAYWPPWAMDMPTGNGTVLSGVLKDVYEALSSSLYCQFQIERQEKRLFGARQPDGTYNGMIGELARKEIDIAGPFVASEERAVVVDFTNSLEISKIGLITGIQSADRSMFLYFKVFSWKVWFFLFFTVVFCALISILVYNVSVNGWKSNQGLLLSNYYWVFWSFLVGQNAGPTDHWPLRDVWYRHSFRILLAAWLLGPVIISIHTFQGMTTSTFAITKFRPVVSGLEELRTKKTIIPVISKGSAVEICFKSSKDHIDIWRRMRNDSIQFSPKIVEDTLLKVEKGTHILFFDYIHALGIVSSWVKRKGRCSIQVQETLFCQTFIALGIRKDFQRHEKERINAQEIDDTLLWNRLYSSLTRLAYIIQAKLTDRWLNRVFNNYTHCTQKLPDESKPLNITDILGGFVMWVIGIMAAFVVLIAEIITFKTLNKKQN